MQPLVDTKLNHQLAIGILEILDASNNPLWRGRTMRGRGATEAACEGATDGRREVVVEVWMNVVSWDRSSTPAKFYMEPEMMVSKSFPGAYFQVPC